MFDDLSHTVYALHCNKSDSKTPPRDSCWEQITNVYVGPIVRVYCMGDE